MYANDTGQGACTWTGCVVDVIPGEFQVEDPLRGATMRDNQPLGQNLCLPLVAVINYGYYNGL